ncbi:DMT family transporter [Terasakiella pusilla]|uniref:DMT family transporter n=1 Tax=Terasakiella pusilla TaxID=64973 RepID=UPI003AA8BA77
MFKFSSLGQDEFSPALGIISALLIAGLWSGFIVVSRMGAQSPLSVYDMAALRFGFAGLVLLPATFMWWPIRLKIWQILILAAGTGVPYALFAYAGFLFAPVSHGGVFINGALPVFTTIVGMVWMKSYPNTRTWIAIAIILLGCGLTAFAKDGFGGGDSWMGDLLFMAAALTMAVYMPATKIWKLTMKELMSFVPFVNAILFLPIWYLFLPSHLEEAETSDILLQMLYQGLGPSILGLVFFFLAIKHLGATPTAAILALVPSIAALLGIPLLGDIPHIYEWVGMGLVTLGIWITLRAK